VLRALVTLFLIALLAAADADAGSIRRITIHYRAHDGARRAAYVVLPAWYGKKNDPPIPLIISPHGRGLSGRANAALWGDLPYDGSFVVVNPDGEGRLSSRYSWGAPGQIEDLARMPDIVRLTLPWVHVDRNEIYAFGGSMGGQESLLLLARHPRLLAGVAAFDAVTDLARQYRSLRLLACGGGCRRAWDGPLGTSLQQLVRAEVGGTPWTHPGAYALRSPIADARRIAASCVPLQLWWSDKDRVVLHQEEQSGRLFRELRRLNPIAPVQAYIGLWVHSAEMRERSQLPLALEAFGLVPPLGRGTPYLRMIPPPSGSDDCGSRR
jgi:pimeloyl-ACP methyl ester carboxylesterase